MDKHSHHQQNLHLHLLSIFLILIFHTFTKNKKILPPVKAVNQVKLVLNVIIQKYLLIWFIIKGWDAEFDIKAHPRLPAHPP